MRKLSRIVTVAGIAALFLVLVRGIALSRYEPRTSEAYRWGAFHVHSTLSDGLAPLEEIARAAKEARIDFVMLSDHGSPHPEAAILSKTIEGVRFIGGSEVGLPDGHLIVSDLERVPRYTLPPYPPEAVSDVRSLGGLSIVTYPEDPVHRWEYWRNDFVPDGIEIVNITSYFRSGSPLRKLSWGLFSLFEPYYYLSAIEPPLFALEKWDGLLERGVVSGFYATNAHGGFPLTEKRTIAVPSYATAFSYVGLGVDRRFQSAPEDAIRRGEFFSVVRGAGEPDRFELRERAEGIEVLLEGAPGEARIDLKRNGEVMASSTSGELRLKEPAKGVYRVEVYLESHPLLRRDVPWILSNPVFVGGKPSPPHGNEPACATVEPIPLVELSLEKDEESQGSLELLDSGALELSYHLSRSTPERVDRWIALALRKEMDLSAYEGIRVRGRTAEEMRYWIEVRSGDDGFYGSAKLLPEGASVDLPWERFYPTLGKKREIPLARIDALFVTVNTSSSRTGFSSELVLEELGFCR